MEGIGACSAPCATATAWAFRLREPGSPTTRLQGPGQQRPPFPLLPPPPSHACIHPPTQPTAPQVQLAWPVNSGVWMLRSQKRTVESPEPLTRRLPSGLKLTDSTESECPVMVAEQRDTGRTRNRAWGWYTTRSTRSMDVCRRGLGRQCEGGTGVHRSKCQAGIRFGRRGHGRHQPWRRGHGGPATARPHLVLEQVSAQLLHQLLVVDLKGVGHALAIFAVQQLVQQLFQLGLTNVGGDVQLWACGSDGGPGHARGKELTTGLAASSMQTALGT